MSNQALKLVTDVQPARGKSDPKGIEALLETIRTTTVIHERIFKTLLDGGTALSPDMADFLEDAARKYLALSKQITDAYMETAFTD